MKWLSLFFLIFLIFIPGCGEQKNNTDTEQIDTVKIGMSQSFFGAPAVIATAINTFSKHGLKAEIYRFQSGKKAFQALLHGEIDVATVADMPLMKKAFKRDDFSIFVTFSRSSNQGKILALKNKIQKPQDLVGKTIAVSFDTTADYYLQAFLKYNNIDANQINMLNTNTRDLAKVLKNREVDAISSWEPYISEAMKLSGEENLTLMSMTNVARVTFNLVSMKTTIKNRPMVLKKVIKSMLDAVNFIHQNPENAHKILATELQTDLKSVEKNLKDYQMYLGLDQGLIFVLENQAKWYTEKKNLKTEFPNFLNIIDTTLMKELYPDAVTLID